MPYIDHDVTTHFDGKYTMQYTHLWMLVQLLVFWGRRFGGGGSLNLYFLLLNTGCQCYVEERITTDVTHAQALCHPLEKKPSSKSDITR